MTWLALPGATLAYRVNVWGEKLWIPAKYRGPSLAGKNGWSHSRIAIVRRGMRVDLDYADNRLLMPLAEYLLQRKESR
jgi:hypothetical protein